MSKYNYVYILRSGLIYSDGIKTETLFGWSKSVFSSLTTGQEEMYRFLNAVTESPVRRFDLEESQMSASSQVMEAYEFQTSTSKNVVMSLVKVIIEK